VIPRSILRIIGLAVLLNCNLSADDSAVSGEAVAPAVIPAPSAPALPALPESAAKADYILRPSDTLQVRIFQEEDLTREISISQEFTVSLPLIGTINLKGKSVRQAEDMIRQLYDKDFLVNPQVTVTVLRYAERTVNVIGAVNSPQAVSFPIEQGLTLLEAITRAGGFSRIANQKDVRITRTDEQGVSKTFSVNAMRLIDSRSNNLWSLEVGDVVFVPESTF
jgi:polysaccharide export outer membrane protein